MARIVLVLCMAAAIAQPSLAAWYWPFSSGDDGGRPRLSEILEPASLLIDDATDLAADGKTSEAVGKYREALVEIDRVEREHADLVDGPEYNSVRNKRAYVNAAIDSLLLSEATRNARPVAVTDTTELQKRYDERRQAKKQEQRGAQENAAPAAAVSAAEKRESDGEAGRGPGATDAPVAPESREARLKMAVEDLKTGDYDSVDLLVSELLEETPNDAAALNIKAAAETGRGKFRDAEKTLDRAIMSNPRSYYAYYNMARLMLEHGIGSRDAARRYYETGRQIGGPANAGLEKELK